MTEWNPYEWHDHHKPGRPRWRVKTGMAEKRADLINQIQRLSDEMETRNSIALVDRWHELHRAILDCEENEPPAEVSHAG